MPFALLLQSWMTGLFVGEYAVRSEPCSEPVKGGNTPPNPTVLTPTAEEAAPAVGTEPDRR